MEMLVKLLWHMITNSVDLVHSGIGAFSQYEEITKTCCIKMDFGGI